MFESSKDILDMIDSLRERGAIAVTVGPVSATFVDAPQPWVKPATAKDIEENDLYWSGT